MRVSSNELFSTLKNISGKHSSSSLAIASKAMAAEKHPFLFFSRECGVTQVRCCFRRIRSDTEIHTSQGFWIFRRSALKIGSVRSSACASLNVHRQCSLAFFFKRRRVRTLPWAPSRHGSSYQWQWPIAGTAICDLCSHVWFGHFP